MVMMQIRPYCESDEAGAARLWREVFPDAPSWNEPEADIRRKLAVQPELFLVATVDSKIVGTVMAGYDGHRGWVHYLAISPERRTQGIGAALMAEVEERLGKMGCPKLNLQIRGTNKEAVAFYRKLGYNVEDRVSMAKHLGRTSERS